MHRITSPWSESTVTWNTKPSYAFVRDAVLTSGTTNRIDVTDQVSAAIAEGLDEIGFALQPSASAPSTDNVFIDAREKIGGTPTYLRIEY